MNFGQLLNTVQRNCHISDARHAGNYSMCTFLLKMREFYRWEHGIPFSEPVPKEELGGWLVEREAAWESLDGANYESLEIDGISYEPFESAIINQALSKYGYVYSSGYGVFNKPHFQLGELHSSETREGAQVLISSCEYVRDLVAPPAMMLDNTIFISRESAQRFFWERLEEWQWKKRDDVPMAYAVKAYSGKDDIGLALENMTDNEIESMVNHELGEIKAGKILGKDWEHMLASLACTQTEFKLRAIRDLLADCISTLPRLISTGNTPSIHFYFGNFTGLRKHLFPGLLLAYHQWMDTGNIEHIHTACLAGKTHWQHVASDILNNFTRARDRTSMDIESMIDKVIL